MDFFRQYEHLLPNAHAWRLTIDRTLRRLFEGLSDFPAQFRAYIDLIWWDLFPSTTRALDEWRAQFGFPDTGSEHEQRERLAFAWRSPGGQSKAAIEAALHAAGFANLFVHEWWTSGPPFVARDPRLYTTKPRVGRYRCRSSAIEQARCRPPTMSQAQCSAVLANDPGYIVNQDLTGRAPPAVPDDPAVWPFFLYVGGATFPDEAVVFPQRRAELEALLLSIIPAQQWLVTLVNYTTGASTFDGTFDITFM